MGEGERQACDQVLRDIPRSQVDQSRGGRSSGGDWRVRSHLEGKVQGDEPQRRAGCGCARDGQSGASGERGAANLAVTAANTALSRNPSITRLGTCKIVIQIQQYGTRESLLKYN